MLRHAQLVAGTMSALMAENLTVQGHAGVCESRHEGLTATGSGPLGAVCLAGASVTGQLSLRGTTLVNESGPALLADLITIGDGARLDQDFSAEGEGEAGAVRLTEATISGDLLLNGARLTNHTGPALLADGLTVHSDLVLEADAASGRRFEAAGAGSRGTILVRGATVSGRLSLDGAHVRRGHAPGSRPASRSVTRSRSTAPPGSPRSRPSCGAATASRRAGTGHWGRCASATRRSAAAWRCATRSCATTPARLCWPIT